MLVFLAVEFTYTKTHALYEYEQDFCCTYKNTTKPVQSDVYI